MKTILITALAMFWTLLQWDLIPCGSVEPQVGEVYRVTAYCPCEKCCGKFADGITASGHKIEQGDRFVAADQSMPFNTFLTIPGYNNGKPVPVLDRGGAIIGQKLDVFFDTHKEALKWGVQYLKVANVQINRKSMGIEK